MSTRQSWRFFLVFFITATMVIPLDFAGTAVAEYQHFIEYYAMNNGLDPTLVAAIILIESSGNPNAVNPVSGAVGLMQIMPHETGSPFLDRPSVDKLLKSETNISTGCEILADLFARKKTTYNVLYHYSGSIYWDSKEGYKREYYDVVLDYMEGLENGRAEYQYTHLSPKPIIGNTKDIKLPLNWSRY